MSPYNPVYGDYFVVSTKGFIGFLIQLGSFSKFNHAGIYIGKDANGVDKIIEATPRHGVIVSDLSQYDGLPLVWNRWDNPTDDQRKLIVATVQKHLKDPYYFRAIFILALRIFGIKVPKWLGGNLSGSKAEFCSDLVVIAFAGAGIVLCPGLQAYEIKPSDLGYRGLGI